MPFDFGSFDHLTDGVLDLALAEKVAANPRLGHVPAYHYRVTLSGSQTDVGVVRLRVGKTLGLLTSGHVGYEIFEPYRGRGYAARACRLLRPVALYHGLDHLIITCDPENLASRRTCENLRAVLIGIFDVPTDHEMYQRGRRKVCRYEWSLVSRPGSHPGLKEGQLPLRA